MILDAFDYSFGRPAPSAMRGAGIKVAARYLHNSSKGLSAQEAADLHGEGFGIVLNYEAEAGNHLLGAGQGSYDGNQARELAQEVGAPALPIYFSCDRDSTGRIGTAVDYLRAADNPDRPSRCYAQYAVCEAFARPAWQTIAWSYGQLSKHAVLYQYAINQSFQGSAVDYDTVLNYAQLGAWWPAGSEEAAGGNAHPISTPKPVLPVEDGMYEILRNTKSGAVRAAGPNYWVALEGKSPAETLNNIANARTGPLCDNDGKVRDVSDAGMTWWKNFYLNGKV